MRGVLLGVFLGLAACTSQSPKRWFLLAESLWSDGNYQAAVTEYMKVFDKEGETDLGVHALYRAAQTQAIFLSQYRDALTKYRRVTELRPNTPMGTDAQKQIAILLDEKLERYEQAIAQYKKLLSMSPPTEEAAEYQFRIAKSYHQLARFTEALLAHQMTVKKYPGTTWAERSEFEMGLTLVAKASQQQHQGGSAEAFQDAMEQFEDFISKHPQSRWVPEARFQIAGCLEELDQLDAAFTLYQGLVKSFPSPRVIEVKLARLKDRIRQRHL